MSTISLRDHNELAFICTDDTILIHTDRDRACQRVRDLESTFERHNILRRADKDETAQDSITAIACHLANEPARVEPDLAKLCELGIFDLALHKQSSPHAMSALLGVAR